MDAKIPFLAGLGSALTGAFIRSCSSEFSFASANAWCGEAPPSPALTLAHEHCAGCGLLALGIMLMAGAALSLVSGHAAHNKVL